MSSPNPTYFSFNSLTATIRGSSYKFCVIWHHFPGARLECYLQNGAVIRGPQLECYLQNGAVIRMPGFALRIKILKKLNSYDIYGFAINIIYKQNSTICTSHFSEGGQGRREIIFRMWEQKPLWVITGKKQCAMPSFAASFVAAKRSFWDVLLDLIGINFRICRISIDPGHPGYVYDVGYVPFERSSEAAIAAKSPPER